MFLNGERVGRTPLWLEEVKAGFYMLKVGGVETKQVAVEENSACKARHARTRTAPLEALGSEGKLFLLFLCGLLPRA